MGIVGAGPAGLVLAHLLHLRGIDSVVLERHTREHIEKRVRAGVLEHGTVELLTAAGLGERLLRERMVHHGLELLFDGEGHRIPLTELTGREITVYGQHEVVKDLVAARLATGRPLHFAVSDVTLSGLTDRPAIRFDDEALDCDFVVGCDGFHGVSRPSIPDGALTVYERAYPYAWLGVLAEAPPSSEELIYALHERGFALHSMRSPSVTRLYLQVRPDEPLEDWPDDAHLGRAAHPAGPPRPGVVAGRRPDPGAVGRADAQLRGRPDAVRAAVPRRRRGAHRAADRRQGAQPGRRRREGARGRAGLLLRHR